MTDSVIRCDHISKEFYGARGWVRVLDDISFKAAKNELLVVFGPGQCGKTTLLKTIAALEPVTGGSVFINEKSKVKPGPECGLVYQTTALFPWLTTMGNIEYGPKVQGMKKKERRQRAEKYIRLVGLEGFETSYPVQLSGGMRQRVGIARVYCNEPEVMLMDEPFGHLDAQTRYLMQEELERIWQTEKRTIIFVTNNIEEAIYLADRILVLTSCPARIGHEFKVDFPRPRNITDPGFLKLRQEITSVLDPAE